MNSINPEEELQVRKTESGVKYVTAFTLFIALRLNPKDYTAIVTSWFSELYGFEDDVRSPKQGGEGEYAPTGRPVRTEAGDLVQDYFIKLALAKQITLSSNSPVRHVYARYLFSLEQKVEDADLLSPQQVVALIDVAKIMGMISCQKAAERQHYSTYLDAGGKYYNWVSHRAELLGYTTETLRDAMLRVGRNSARRNHRVMLIQSGQTYMTIRAGVVDLFAALGKTNRYAQNMGELAYKFATEMKIHVWDDRDISIDFSHHLNQELIQEVQALQKQGFMGLW